MNDGATDYGALSAAPRLLMECDLRPLQGARFQPTGFPDLGPARYVRPDGTEMLLVDSAQSIANRLEATIWDTTADDVVKSLNGLPYIAVIDDTNKKIKLTNSILEAHRINSPYILEGTDRIVFERLKQEAAGLEKGPVSLRGLAKIIFKYDPNAVLHGVFLAKKELAGGRLRMTRLLSGFIEAESVSPAESGGVKNDRVDPSGETAKGFGNVPFHRTEFVAKRITAYFNLDLSLLRGYGLQDHANKLLTTLALLQIRRFLSSGLRLRTACDLESTDQGLKATRPSAFNVPDEDTLLKECETLVSACAAQGLFAKPPITEVRWQSAKSARIHKGRRDKEEQEEEEVESDEDSES